MRRYVGMNAVAPQERDGPVVAAAAWQLYWFFALELLMPCNSRQGSDAATAFDKPR